MQSTAWVTLLRHIPAQVHENLMVMTLSGTEIAIQTLLRIDREFVAIKGRVAGSQLAGRVFFIAYDQIDYFGFQQEVKDEKFQELFAGLTMPGLGAAEAAATAIEVPTVEQASNSSPVPTPVIPEPTPRVTPPGSRAIKSVVLERFRSRTARSGLRPRLPHSDEPPPGMT
jgi:hypothetical protein